MAGEFDNAPFQEGLAFFVNTCRGKTVYEQALTLALERVEIAGAGLDVFE